MPTVGMEDVYRVYWEPSTHPQWECGGWTEKVDQLALSLHDEKERRRQGSVGVLRDDHRTSPTNAVAVLPRRRYRKMPASSSSRCCRKNGTARASWPGGAVDAAGRTTSITCSGRTTGRRADGPTGRRAADKAQRGKRMGTHEGIPLRDHSREDGRHLQALRAWLGHRTSAMHICIPRPCSSHALCRIRT